MSEKTNNVVDLSQLSTKELEELLEAKKASKNKEQKKLEQAYDRDKADFIHATTMKFISIHNELKELKLKTITDANILHSRMWEIQGKEPKEQKTFSLKTDKMKITVDRQERFEFTEEANVHIQSIKDIMRSKFEGRNKGFYNFMESMLMRNTKGELDPKLLAKGRKQANELANEELIDEYLKLENCQRVTGSAMYCRAYKKDEEGRWKDINIQFSSL